MPQSTMCGSVPWLLTKTHRRAGCWGGGGFGGIMFTTERCWFSGCGCQPACDPLTLWNKCIRLFTSIHQISICSCSATLVHPLVLVPTICTPPPPPTPHPTRPPTHLHLVSLCAKPTHTPSNHTSPQTPTPPHFAPRLKTKNNLAHNTQTDRQTDRSTICRPHLF